MKSKYKKPYVKKSKDKKKNTNRKPNKRKYNAYKRTFVSKAKRAYEGVKRKAKLSNAKFAYAFRRSAAEGLLRNKLNRARLALDQAMREMEPRNLRPEFEGEAGNRSVRRRLDDEFDDEI